MQNFLFKNCLITKYFFIFAENYYIMIDIDAILNGDSIPEIISSLKNRTTIAPNWAKLATDYEPSLHRIVEDMQGRQDKIHSNGTKDTAARLSVGLEKLLTKRITEFTFAIPVKRVYSGMENDSQKDIAKAIERIYNVAHIDAENKRRGLAYYASCEILSIWYTKKVKHNLYGFPCQYKLKCKTFSPMDGTTLWPLIDEQGEMYAMSYEYRRRVKDEWVNYFETFTADRHYIWKLGENSKWESVVSGEEISIEKIPAIYLYRPKPVWDGLTRLREDIEYSLSRNSDVIAYNSAPILKVAGTIVGDEVKGESRRVYRVMEGGDVSYVSWAQSIAALQYHVDTLQNLFFMQAQMPDISFTNMRALGNIGYDARKTLFADAHLKIGDESGPWLEFLERENNVIKAFLKKLNVGFSESDIDAVMIENVISPFIIDDDMRNIEKWQKAGGGTALVSPKEAIENAGLSNDAEQTLAEIMAFSMTQQAMSQPTEADIPVEEEPAEGGTTEEEKEGEEVTEQQNA